MLMRLMGKGERREEACLRRVRDRPPFCRESRRCELCRWSEAGGEMEGKEARDRPSGRREGIDAERRRIRRRRRRDEEKEGNDWSRFGRVGGKLE